MKFWAILLICIVVTPWFWKIQIPQKSFEINLREDIRSAKILVEWKRGKTSPSSFARLFINWPLEMFNQRIGIVMENLDIGNYVFVGHPRERVGIVEVQKFFIFQFVLFGLGFANSNLQKYIKFILLYFAAALVCVFLFKLRTAFETLILAPPIVIISALGFEKLLTTRKRWKFLLLVFSMIEITLFLVFQT